MKPKYPFPKTLWITKAMKEHIDKRSEDLGIGKAEFMRTLIQNDRHKEEIRKEGEYHEKI